MAKVSLRPGQDWTEEVWKNLKTSEWVIFLASENACKSPYVQQELGGALATQKKLIPIVWDIEPEKLPGWMNHKHALDLRGYAIPEIKRRVSRLAEEFRAEKTTGNLVAVALVAGLLLLSNRSNWWRQLDKRRP
jgi:hypothetical protein